MSKMMFQLERDLGNLTIWRRRVYGEFEQKLYISQTEAPQLYMLDGNVYRPAVMSAKTYEFAMQRGGYNGNCGV